MRWLHGKTHSKAHGKAHGKAHDERGASLIETALMSFVLLLLFAGAVDIGRMYYSYVIVTNATREGARTAARLPCTTTIKNVVRARIVQSIEGETDGLSQDPPGAVTITLSPDPAAACYVAGQKVTVSVAYDYNFLLTGILGAAPVRLSNATVMVAYGNDQLAP